MPSLAAMKMQRVVISINVVQMEWLVRGIGRIRSMDDIQKIPVAFREGRAVSLSMIASITEAAQIKRGDASAFVRKKDSHFSGGPAVVLTISKQQAQIRDRLAIQSSKQSKKSDHRYPLQSVLNRSTPKALHRSSYRKRHGSSP